MKKSKTVWLTILCALILAGGAFSVLQLPAGMQRKIALEWIGKKEYEYEGRISVWHVPGAAFGRGNGRAFLQARIEEFEGKHFGIYFDLTVLTQEEALENLYKNNAWIEEYGFSRESIVCRAITEPQ